MPTFKITFDGWHKDELPITVVHTQLVQASTEVRAIFALYEEFIISGVTSIEQVIFDTAEYLRANADPATDFPEYYPKEQTDTPFSEAIGEERWPHCEG